MENATQKKLFPTIGDVVVMFVVFFVAQLLLGVVLGQLGLLRPELVEAASADPELYMAEQEALSRYMVLIYPLSMAVPLFFMWLYVRLRGGKGGLKIRHKAAGFNPIIILVGIIWLLSSQIVLEPLIRILPGASEASVGRGVWAWVTVAVLAPIIEELLCRGVILETLRRRWSTILSIVVTALFFGLIHGDISTIIVATVAGIIFGVIYERTSSIFSTIIIHAINNVLAFTLICLGFGEISLYEIVGDGWAYYLSYSVVAVIFVAISIEAYVNVFVKKKAEDEKTEEIEEKKE